MKVLTVKTDNSVKATQIFTQRNNEVQWADIRKLMSSNVEPLYLRKISRLAYLYIMYAEKTAQDRPLNRIATLLLGDPERAVRGDAVITRTDHLGSGAKILALEDDEVQKIIEKMSILAGGKIEILKT